MCYSYELLNYHALSWYHVGLLCNLVLSENSTLAHHMTYRRSCMTPIADDMLVTAMYVLILVSVADLECDSYRLMDNSMAMKNL